MSPGDFALWHRSRKGLPPRPVFVLAVLPQKVRVIDCCEGTRFNLKVREVLPANLTPVYHP